MYTSNCARNLRSSDNFDNFTGVVDLNRKFHEPHSLKRAWLFNEVFKNFIEKPDPSKTQKLHKFPKTS